MISQTEVRRNEQGMTLIEMVISLLIYGIVVAGALGFAATQNTALHKGLDIMRSLQNARYTLRAMETDLITLGTNLPGAQPALVAAGRDVIVFNADYASNVANDVFASYIDPDAPGGQVTAMDTRITLPNTSFQYPDTLYTTAAGTRSPGETLMYYFQADATSARTDDYVLYRKVNSRTPEVLSRNILAAADGTPFFRYFRRRDFVSAPSVIDSISDSALPIWHKARIHLSPADTGQSALTDSVRAVRVSFRTSNGLVGPDERLVSVSRVITFPNAGFGTFSTCGDEPMLGTGISAAAVALGGGGYGIQLTWSPATDETGGEADVARYVIYRQQTVVTSDWGDPYLSIPAGQTSYLYLDESVTSGELYQYALAAQDCTPKLSALATSGTVIVP